MAANFFLSSHANHHLHPRAALQAARLDDYKYASEEEIGFIEIWSAISIQQVCRRLGLRQQVAATAVIYFRRFYLRNAYCETDPVMVATACCYVAAKAEETPVHVKSALIEARTVFNEMGCTTLSSDNSKVAEMEFFLIEELDFHLLVFHPYRSLAQICGRDGLSNGSTPESRAHRDAMLKLDDAALHMTWFILNDTYRSSVCLVYPPHLIALAAIYLALSVHGPPSSASSDQAGDFVGGPPASRTRRTSISTSADGSAAAPSTQPASHSTTGKDEATTKGGKADAIGFLASLNNIDDAIVMEIVQEIVSLYKLWHAYEHQPALGQRASDSVEQSRTVIKLLTRMRNDRTRDIIMAAKSKSSSSSSSHK